MLRGSREAIASRRKLGPSEFQPATR